MDSPKRGDGSVDLARIDPSLRRAAQRVADNIDVYESGTRLVSPSIGAVRLSWLGDPSFESYEDAIAHLTGPKLPDDATVDWNQALLDVSMEYAIGLDYQSLAIATRLSRLGNVTTVLRVRPTDGIARDFEYTGDPGVFVLDPRWTETASRFFRLGLSQAIRRPDLFLVLLCAVLPFRRVRPLLLIVAAFGVALAVTLIGSGYGFGADALWFQPLVDTLSAAAIVYLALENIVGAGVERRWLLAGVFGLVYGFGSAASLQPSRQFAGEHVLVSSLSFTTGAEFGLLILVALLAAMMYALFRYAVGERGGTIVLSALALHSAWHWLLERGERLRHFAWPALDTMTLIGAMRMLIVVVLLIGLWWLAFALRGRNGVGTGGLGLEAGKPQRSSSPQPPASGS